MKNNTKKFVLVTMLSAMAITLNIIESMFFGGILPLGIRVGLANIIALITIVSLGVKEMIVVNIMRVFIGNLMRGLIFGSTFWIALGGVVLSSILLIVCNKILKSSLMFTSIVSSIAHSIGQVVVVAIFYKQPYMFAIVPYLLLSSVPMGILTGIVGKNALRLIDKNVKL
ncbi:MAG: Gx transporter family protein [Erysipelotrichaceae bacterium]|nr:Gx transporter family protein [Erysipelotrichaceae bacterium]